MKLAIMQPYFFPYLGYFQLIRVADRFILADDVRYIRHGWINRNRILKPVEGHQYIIMPIAKHATRTPIKDIKATEGFAWKAKALRQIEHYRSRAPFYSEILDVLRECFDTTELNVAKLNGMYLKAICDYIGLAFNVEISSAMGLDYSGVAGADDWALSISAQLGASAYVNSVGGSALYDRTKFARLGIELTFLKPHLKEYSQCRGCFEPALSIIDVLMFNSRQMVKSMLDDFELL